MLLGFVSMASLKLSGIAVAMTAFIEVNIEFSWTEEASEAMSICREEIWTRR